MSYVPPHKRNGNKPDTLEQSKEVFNVVQNSHDDVKEEEDLICRAFTRICCINLSKRPDKWKYFQREASRIGESFQRKLERFDAVDGQEIASFSNECNDVALEWNTTTNSKYDRHVEPGIRVMTPGEVGCALSHVSLWRQLALSTDPNASMLIFEDDAAFLSDGSSRHRRRSYRGESNSPHRSRFVEAFAKVWSSLPPDWGFLYLGFSDRGDRIPVFPKKHHNESFTYGKNTHSRHVKPLEIEIFQPTYGFHTHAYAITREAAISLLEMHLPVSGPIDVWLADNQWFSIPAYCAVVSNEGWRGTGAWLVSQNKKAGSDIGMSGRE
mmetsp:Transcript_37106/g.54560  ORF Transcript_37106/g.54560 Transcript_37106/m.54560 type:complete len:325 (-) Transcript_37106:160-1134(-)